MGNWLVAVHATMKLCGGNSTLFIPSNPATIRKDAVKFYPTNRLSKKKDYFQGN